CLSNNSTLLSKLLLCYPQFVPYCFNFIFQQYHLCQRYWTFFIITISINMSINLDISMYLLVVFVRSNLNARKRLAHFGTVWHTMTLFVRSESYIMVVWNINKQKPSREHFSCEGFFYGQKEVQVCQRNLSDRALTLVAQS